VPSLKARREVSRLKYLVKVMTMERGRLVRELLRLEQGPAVLGQGLNNQWRPRIVKMLNEDDWLGGAFDRVHRSAKRNHEVVPRGVDPNYDAYAYSPVKSWHSFLRRWSLSRDLDEFKAEANMQRSTLRIMHRAVDTYAERVPAFPITKAPNRGQNQIRLRLLCGTSALNDTMSHWTDRTAKCAFGCDSNEDACHFLLDCATTADLRRDYMSRLTDSCECARRTGAGGEVGCADFFAGLDPDGKALFMLGGPVDGREPEPAIDSAAKRYVALAYERRSALLNKEAETPLICDLTGSVSGKVVGSSPSPTMLRFYPPMSAPISSARAAATRPATRPAARNSISAPGSTPRLAVVCAHGARARARPNRSSDAAPSPEPGLDSMILSREAL